MLEEIFRAYDIRGIVKTQLTPELVIQIGRAIGTAALNHQDDTVVVGRDGRLSGESVSQSLIQGLLSTGCHVIDVGMVPTPVLYFATQYLQVGSGVIITGSHNPPDYNGFKIVMGHKALYGEAIQALHASILKQDFRQGKGVYLQKMIIEPYLQWIVKTVQLQRPLKIVVDAGNGVTGVLLERLFTTLGCEVVPLFCEVDGHFPNHHPDPGQPKNLSALQAAVLNHQADCGLAFDGDGDRLGVVDHQSNIIWPDRVLMLFIQAILQEQPHSPIIFDVKCTQHLAPWIQKWGGIPCMWKTGHSLIKAKMRELDAPLAGEMSGHFFFKACYGFDDALYAGAYLLSLLSQTTQKTGEVFNALPNRMSTPEVMVPIAEKEKFNCIQTLIEQAFDYGPFKNGVIHTIDGLRVDFKDGFGLVRCSNTSPNLICRFEGDTQVILARICTDFRGLLKTVNPQLELPF